MAKLSKAELAKREDVIMKMKKNKRSLVKRYGPDAEKVMYGRATNIAKKVAESEMENINLKELVRAALMNEKAGFSKEYDNDPALKGGQKNLPDGLQKAIISKAKSANEDLDLGHTDNEPHMLKGDLYRIGKYAMELYQMVDEFEGKGEVDFPHWWQAKIIKAKEMMSSAKHYLDFETKEPEIDAMVGAIDMSGALDNIGVEDEIEEGLPKGYFKKATAKLDESFEKLVGKLKKGGKSEKAAKAIAGAVANYKAKGGGKGPTAKQKVKEGLFGNNFKKVDTIEYSGYEMDVWSDGKEKLIGHPRKKGQKSSAEEYNSEKFLGYSLDKLNQLKTAIDYMNSGREDFNFPLYKKKFNNPNFVTTKVDVG